VESQQLLEIQKKVEEIVISSGMYALSKWEDVVAVQKGDEGDVVTDVDKIIEDEIRTKLGGLVSGATVVGEESGGEGSGLYWVIDPIDGTKNYAHKMPGFLTQVALISNNEPILGVVYDPVARHLFSASKSNGTSLNGIAIAYQPRVDSLSKAVIDIDFGGTEDWEWKSKVFANLTEQTYRVRVSGGRFSPYLLTGGVNAVLVVNPTTKAWDQLPRLILMQEAGFDIRSSEREGHIVRVMSEPTLADKIWEIVNGIQ
jgi:myo-inositol-1(or 4)-monophosphatase